MTAVESPPATGRLLSGVTGAHARCDLATHERLHGPLPTAVGPHRAEALTAALAEAGLTGRGGAAFPTARKLETARGRRRRPVLAVNAVEGEPASRKDHVLAVATPHLVLDGAILVAGAVDAAAVVICVSRDDPAAAASLTAAVGERQAAGRPTAGIEVRCPPARYVAGEESALVHWLDGADARPTFRADRPAVLRVGRRPVLVHNAETLAHAALIARHGPGWFRGVGTPDSPGTALVTVSGAVRAPGVMEVALGTPVADVLEAAGYDPTTPGVLLGGYGGTWLPAAHLHTPLAATPLAALGASMGAGVLAVLPAGGCGLAETARVAAYMAGESAGQCGPCAFGLPAVAEDLAQLAFGQASATRADQLWRRLATVEGRGACHHPDGVVRMVRSAVTAFADDLDGHLRRGPCPGAGAPTVLPFPDRDPAPVWR